MTAVKSRRRPVRAPTHAQTHVGHPARPSLAARIARIAASPSAQAAYVMIGTAGLAAIAVAIIGPKRLNREVLKPLRGAVEGHAGKLWDESRDLRQQMAGLFDRAGANRDKLIRSFQSWAGHFRAT